MSVKEQISTGSGARNLAEELLLPSELARMIGKTERTLANWRCARTGPKYVKLGSTVRYRVNDVEDWIEAQRVETEP